MFPNPVGLAAGFDKNARLMNILPAVGFGFAEFGSMTANASKGNPKPRLFRLPKDNALIVNYGLANDGVEIIAQRVEKNNVIIPFGLSIAKTNDTSIKGNNSIEDYYRSYQRIKNLGAYITINISCPNAGDGRSFEDVKLLGGLLKKIGKQDKMIFLKLSPDIAKKNVDKIINLAEKYKIAGFVVANLTHDRSRLKTPKKEIENKKGGISGMPVREKSAGLLRDIYTKTRGKFILVSVGGIFSAEDAYARIKDGASLVQVVTGMIYKGPGIIKEINKGLVRLMEKEGYKSIQEAVGKNIV